MPRIRPSIEQLVRLRAGDRLACYGNVELVLEGMIDFSCSEAGAYPFAFVPDWLASNFTCIGIGAEDPAARGFNRLLLPLRLRAGVYDWQRGDLVRVRGHLDDAAAVDCRVELPPGFGGPSPLDPVFHVLFCREQFVAEEVTVVGHHNLPPQY